MIDQGEGENVMLVPDQKSPDHAANDFIDTENYLCLLENCVL